MANKAHDSPGREAAAHQPAEAPGIAFGREIGFV